jgi:hypothetical protein
MYGNYITFRRIALDLGYRTGKHPWMETAE